MHSPTRPRRSRAAIAALLAAAALLVATVSPAAARPPGPPSLPALAGFVTDACTGLPILGGLDVSVVGPDGGIAKPPNPNRLGLFSFPSLAPGTYQLLVSAPGYDPLGADPATGGLPGVMVAKPPGPPALPAGQSLSIGLILSIGLAPTVTPGTCKPPNPNLPALAGRGIDAATGRGLAGLVVGMAPLVIDPTTGASPPGPPTLPAFSPLFGFFVFPALAPGDYLFSASAPGHLALGDDPTKPPNPNGPGVMVTSPPGPPSLPAGQSVSEGLVLSVVLPAVQ